MSVAGGRTKRTSAPALPPPHAHKATRATPWERGNVAWLFLAPALLLITIFFFLPVAAALLLSFTDFDIYAVGDPENARFVWLRNYADLLRNPLFWTALKNTFYFVLVGGPLSVAVSLGAALLVDAKAARFKPFFRAVYFAPVVTTLVAVARHNGRVAPAARAPAVLPPAVTSSS